jgi:flagellar biosynthetic protein FliQ
MTMEFVMQICAEAMFAAAKIAGPILGAGLVAGLAIAVFQAVTQIHEMTLTFIPKILAAALTVAFMYEFMMRSIVDFTVRIINLIPGMVH